MRKFWCILLGLLLIALCLIMAGGIPSFIRGNNDNNNSTIIDKPVLNVWYTDSTMQEYIESAANEYSQVNNVEVVAKQCSSLEYLENIQKASMEDEGPDVYLISNDCLEKAYLSGLARKADDKDGVINTAYFPNAAVDAVKYGDMTLGYPVSFDTAFFIYNKTYTDAITSGSQELPTSLVGILDFANNNDAPENVESFFAWAVKDVMFDYFFGGAYIDVGGEKGDNHEQINIYNSDAMYGLEVFQDFNQFFSIDAQSTDYESVIQDFIDGKLVFTVATTDAVKTLADAKESGKFAYDYDILQIGMLNDSLLAKGLSITECAVINEYGDNWEESEKFAKYISVDYAPNMYSLSNNMCARTLDNEEYPQMTKIRDTYCNSVSIPKIVESSNFWVLAEKMYTNVWNGENSNEKLLELSLQIKNEITGSAVTDDIIDTPVVVENYTEEE